VHDVTAAMAMGNAYRSALDAMGRTLLLST